MTAGELAILQQLADTSRQQAVTSQEQAVLTARLISVLEKVDNHLERMDIERERDMKTLAGTIRSIKVTLLVFASIIALGDILREPVGKLLSLIPH